MIKPIAMVANLSNVYMVRSSFEHKNLEFEEGSSLSIGLKVDHEFKTENDDKLLICKYEPEIIGLTPDDEELFVFTLQMNARYELQEIHDWSPEDALEFIEKCANFHVWPFIREHVNSVTTKALIPAVMLPLLPSGDRMKLDDSEG